MIRLTIRATDESVPAVLLKVMQDRLAAGFTQEKFQAPTPSEISDAFSNILVT